MQWAWLQNFWDSKLFYFLSTGLKTKNSKVVAWYFTNQRLFTFKDSLSFYTTPKRPTPTYNSPIFCKRVNPLEVPEGFEKFFPQKEGKLKNATLTHRTKRQENGEKRKRHQRSYSRFSNSIVAFVSACAVWQVVLQFIRYDIFHRGFNEITTQTFLTELLAKKYVERIEIVNNEWVRVILRPDAPLETLPPSRGVFSFRIGSLDFFEQKLEKFQKEELDLQAHQFIPIHHVRQTDYLRVVCSHLPTLLWCAAGAVILRRFLSFGSMEDAAPVLKMRKARPASAKDLKVKVKFSDVAGMREAKNEIKELVEFLREPQRFQHLGAHIPKGTLLVGPPGIGKTLLAKAVAGEANVPFYSMSGSDFMEVFVGIGPSRVRDLFAQARKNAPSIIFVDEIDAVGRKRNKGGGFASGATDERENTLNQMLVEMDGFTSTTGVVVLAGTNRADILDPALTRPGRFDRTLLIEKPDLLERAEIFAIHMKPLLLEPTLDPEQTRRRLAALTPGYVGADIRNVCNEAAIMAARRNAPAVGIEDLENACEKSLGGLRKTGGFIDEDVRRAVAYHEAGHAVVGWFMRYADPVLKVSIVPRTSGTLGFAQNLPDEIQLLPQQQVRDKIAVLLGGRVSEELILGRPSTGASDDLDKATKLAYAFVSVWGFSPTIGLISFQPAENVPTMSYYQRPYSEELAQLIDREVRNLIDYEYKRVKALLQEKLQLIDKLAQRLLLQETITFADLSEILGDRPFPVKEAYSQYVSASPIRKLKENFTHIQGT